ncbi:MAG: AAA family ATPase [Saprospiraceae bacterium]|nr:AAA family ATPase [Saprospiraceae bacterium]
MLDKVPLELNADFQYALDAIEKQGANVFLTGRAGTGKSTLLQLFRSTTRKKTVVLAPTGVAALNVRGQTIHSFFGFPPRMFPRQEIKKRRDRRLYQKLEVLVIDEISMVRADIVDHIDYFLRLHRDTPEPFGGVQVVFIGDLFQLPPVVSSSNEAAIFQQQYETPYFFSANVFREGFSLEMIELQKVYRQEQRHFLRLLESVRLNTIDYEELDELNERHLPGFETEEFYITLSSRNAKADSINQAELTKIPLPEQRYQASISGEFNPNLAPADPVLRLKLNAQVMFLKNDPDRQFVNGTIGKVVKLEHESVTVMVEESPGERRYVEVKPMSWESLRYKVDPLDPDKIEAEVTGAFTQIPLRLAWAVTIHKAQGKTFDKVIIDLDRGAFEHGQTYVALSRCRTFEGIVLRQPIRPDDIRTDERVIEFYKSMI